MIYVFHGDNIVESRNQINLLRKEPETIYFELDPDSITLDTVSNKYFSSELFQRKLLVVVDATLDKSVNYVRLIELLKKTASENTLIFWSRGTLSKTHPLIKSGLTVREFKEEVKSSVFSFLDALFEKRKKDAYREFGKLISNGTDEFEILAMVVYGARNISYALFDSQAMSRLHPFVKRKTLAQAKLHDKESFCAFFRFLYEGDLNLKTGRADPLVLLPLVIEKITS